MKKLTKSHIVFLIFFLLVVANSKYLVNENINSYLEYIVCGCLTLLSGYTFIKNWKEQSKPKITLFIVTIFLFSIGILLQGLDISSKIRLVLTMIALATYIILSGNILNNYKDIRLASYGMIAGTIFTTIIALITKTNMNETIRDETYSFLNTGFTGGMQFKNYYAATILASFIGIYLHYKNQEKNKIDFVFLIILCILEILSGSKGGYLLFITFIISEQLARIEIKNKIKISKYAKYIGIVITACLSIIALKWGYENVLLKSDTYAYRIRGVQNYIDYVKNDPFHLLFGNAEMAFSSSNYVQNIRDFLNKNEIAGYNGSYEMGFINTLIKNGIIGLIGFFICYIYFIKKALSFCKKEHKITILSILLVLLVSALVESYVCNIHAIFGVYSYILIAGIICMGENEKNIDIETKESERD